MAHVAFDHSDSLRPCDKSISWLNRTPHAIAVYASWPALPSAHATLATGRPATALPGPVLHRLDRASFAWRLPESALKVAPVLAANLEQSIGDLAEGAAPDSV